MDDQRHQQLQLNRFQLIQLIHLSYQYIFLLYHLMIPRLELDSPRICFYWQPSHERFLSSFSFFHWGMSLGPSEFWDDFITFYLWFELHWWTMMELPYRWVGYHYDNNKDMSVWLLIMRRVYFNLLRVLWLIYQLL